MEGKPKKITFDEEVIKEHDKERGTRTKILEPKTPFSYLDSSEEEDPANLQSASEQLENIQKKRNFEEKRKAHYNEFQLVKQLKNQGTLSDEED